MDNPICTAQPCKFMDNVHIYISFPKSAGVYLHFTKTKGDNKHIKLCSLIMHSAIQGRNYSGSK